MSNYKILVKITGSIAAYKSAYLISKLVQNNFEVKTVASSSALEFIGKATLEGLTGNPVYTDIFENGGMMNHINLSKWADLTIVVPASANTINKFTAGISDNLITSLFLARDWSKPYLIAPAMNVNMYKHPATQESLAKLEAWGINVLPTDSGYLACGDQGEGKLLEPDKIYAAIVHSLKRNSASKKILITAGGTKENIDGVRFVANMSTGKTGASIAEELYKLGNDVSFITAKDAAMPQIPTEVKTYFSFEEFNDLLTAVLKSNSFDAVIHLAAVSDYKPAEINVGGKSFELPLDNKFRSESDEVFIKLIKNVKLVDKIKELSKNKNVKLTSFKLLEYDERGRAEMEIANLFSRSQSDFVVFNSLNNRPNNRQSNFEIHIRGGGKLFAETAFELADKLNSIFEQEDK